MNYIGGVVDEFIRWFSIFDVTYFDGELSEPIFTIQRARANNLGHCTLHPIWLGKDDSDQPQYEINVSAHSLHRDAVDIAGTILHELIHLYHISNGIKDCSGQIHNKKFKKKAESLGFIVEKSKQCGWGHTTVSQELRDFIEKEVKPKENVFEYARIAIPDSGAKEKTEKNKRQFKFLCPNCGAIAKAKKDVSLLCGACRVEMEMEEEN